MHEQAIFQAALEIEDAARRAEYLRQTCDGKPALRIRLEGLLAAHERPGGFLEKPILQQETGAAESSSRRTIETPGAGEGRRRVRPVSIDLSFLRASSRPGSLGRLKHYEIQNVIGQGGFGIVLKAFDRTLRRSVAIKVLAPELAATSPARKRFLREARAAAAIQHENVVNIHAVEELPLPFLVMEYVAGQTLQEKLDRTGPLDPRTILHLAQQIASGLEAAHAKGLIHRDIKPANILLENGRNRIKITDFGLARTSDDASLTVSGVICGTPLYMSPEQAQGKAIDQRSDLFSLGSVLYVMCSGRPPFRAPSTLMVLNRVVEDKPRPIEEIIPEVPRDLISLIAKLHAKPPEDRFASARQVMDSLAKCQSALQRPRSAGLHREAMPEIRKPPVAVSHSGQVKHAQPQDREPPPGREPLRSGNRRWMRTVALCMILFAGLATSAVIVTIKIREASDHGFSPVPAAEVEAPTASNASAVPDVTSPRSAYLNRTGAWSVEGGDLVQMSLAADCQLVFGDFRWKDYDFSCLAKKTSDRDGIRILHHVTGAGHDYFQPAGPSPENAVLAGAVVRGASAEHGRVHIQFEKNRWYKLMVSCRGGHCQCFIDDQMIFDYRAEDNAQGAVGLATQYAAIHFRDIRVTDPRGKVLWAGPPELANPIVGQWPPATERGLTAELQCFTGHNSPVTSVAFTSVGNQVLSCSDGEYPAMQVSSRWPGGREIVRWYAPASSIRLWDAATGQQLDAVSIEVARGFVALAQSPAGPEFATYLRDHTEVDLWSTSNGQIVRRLKLPLNHPWGLNIVNLGFTPDGHSLRGVHRGNGRTWEWSADDGLTVRDVAGRINGVLCAAIAPDGQHALLAVRNEPLAEIDLDTGQPTGRWQQRVGPIRSIAISRDSRRAVTGGEDGTVRLWDMQSANQIHVVGTHPRPILAVAISPDGRQALSGGEDHILRLWNLDLHYELAQFAGHTATVRAVAFSPDGRRAASASEDYTVRLWQCPGGSGPK